MNMTTQNERCAEWRTYEKLAQLTQGLLLDFLRNADAIAEAMGVPDFLREDRHDGEFKIASYRYHSDLVIDRAATTLRELVDSIELEARIAEADVRRNIHASISGSCGQSAS
jgi:hypothetical protein